LRQDKWIAARSERLLPVQHFHVVFTLPSELRALSRRFPQEVFAALFSAAHETLLELGETRLHARLGVTMLLHTWTRELLFHPHVHALVTAGGLALDGSCWSPCNRKYLFAVQVMGSLLRGKMLARLRALHKQAVFNRFTDFEDPEGFERLMGKLASHKRWIVYAKQPFQHAEHVLKYLGRYTHRVGISNSRLLNVTKDAVTFRTKNSKSVTITPVQFLKRFVQHVLPDSFHKIRHYGLYAGSCDKTRRFAQQRLAPNKEKLPCQTPSCWPEHLRELTGRDIQRCPLCNGLIEHRPLPARSGRAPPW